MSITLVLIHKAPIHDNSSHHNTPTASSNRGVSETTKFSQEGHEH
jgi:hypothetical protein